MNDLFKWLMITLMVTGLYLVIGGAANQITDAIKQTHQCEVGK
jgi:hypothetical protein